MNFNPLSLIKGCYTLPGDPSRDVYVCPLSGGADSAVLAILLRLAFPEVRFLYVFTDTLADPPETMEVLDKLEKYLDIQVDRVVPPDGQGLYQLIERYGGFLPDSMHRWCTRQLKIVPFEKWLASVRPFFGSVYVFVGIRADEPWRTALLSREDWVTTELPMKEWGIVRADVFRVLSETIGVPSWYAHRSRSGCYACWGQRRSEVIGLLRTCPVEFHKVGSYEKLSPEDAGRQREVISVPAETGIAANWLAFPIPKRIDCRTRDRAAPVDWKPFNRKAQAEPQLGLSILDDDPIQKLWVGVEFRVHPGVGSHGIWWRQIVSFGTTVQSIKRQLQGFWELRLKSPEALGMTIEEVREEVKLAVYCIEVPKSAFDLTGPGKESFTWRKGESYLSVEKTVNFAVRSLHVNGLQIERREFAAACKSEAVARTLATLAKIREPFGRVLASDLFVPAEPKDVEDEDESITVCAACSI